MNNNYFPTYQAARNRYHLATGQCLPQRSIYHLPFQRFQGAIWEVSDNLKVSYDMVMLVALAAVALSCQGLAVVHKPRGGCSPLSLMLMLLASPGQKKSPLISKFFSHVEGLQTEIGESYQKDLEEFNADLEIWAEEKKVIKKRMLTKGNQEQCNSHEKKELREHILNKPKKPKRHKLLYKDTTGAGLWHKLKDRIANAAVVTSEGSKALESWTSQDFCNFNMVHDGEMIDISRGNSEDIELEATLTFLLALQPEKLDKLMEGKGKGIRDLGVFARFLTCRPESNAGDRFDNGGEQSNKGLDAFVLRQMELMRMSCEASEGDTARHVLEFDRYAVERWFNMSNEIEEAMREGGTLVDVKDQASKLMDLISRVAGNLHYFEGNDGDISVRTLDAAIEICAHYSDYYCSQFAHPPQHVMDAIFLDDFLNRRYRSKGFNWVSKNEVRNGISKKELRVKSRFDVAYLELCQSRCIMEMRELNSGKKETVYSALSPQFMQVAPEGYYFPYF